MYLIISNVLKKGGESVFCSNCGKQMEDSSAFCPECGTKNENLTIDTNSISQIPNPNMQHSQQPMHGQGIPQNQQVLQNQPLQSAQQPMGQPQMPTNSYPIPKGDKESKNVIKFILIAVVMVAVLIIGIGMYQVHVEEQYIDNVKGMEFENEYYGHRRYEEVVVAMARYVTGEKGITKQDFEWDYDEDGKNVVVTATCDGPKGKVIIKAYTREKNNYVTSDSNRITVSYNGKTSTLTELF